MIVTGARIYTLNSARPIVTSLAVRDGRIVYTGDDASAYSGPQTRRVEARGAAIIPGFIDSHAHVEGLGDQLETIDLRNVRSVVEVAALVRKAAAALPKGTWIRGRSWDQTNWGGRFPSAADLDAAAPENPVYLVRVDGHAAWVNTRALQVARVSASTADPHGGKIHRDAAGRPTGILIDNAQGLIAKHIPTPTLSETRRRLEAATRECARLGITTVHDAGVGEQTLTAYRDLIEKNALPVRVYAMIGGPGELWDRYRKRGPEVGERLVVRSIKLIADGALGSRGAAMLPLVSPSPRALSSARACSPLRIAASGLACPWCRQTQSPRVYRG
jgi:predicted amidohydrolase YtcJ